MKTLIKKLHFIHRILRSRRFILIECDFSSDSSKLDASVNTFQISEEKTMLACITVAMEIKQMMQVLSEAHSLLNQTLKKDSK
jgi:hypothetical protein